LSTNVPASTSRNCADCSSSRADRSSNAQYLFTKNWSVTPRRSDGTFATVGARPPTRTSR
jgi:hypothetical protein